MNWIVYLMSVAAQVQSTLYVKMAILITIGVILVATGFIEEKGILKKTGIGLLATAVLFGTLAMFIPHADNMLKAKSQYQELCE